MHSPVWKRWLFSQTRLEHSGQNRSAVGSILDRDFTCRVSFGSILERNSGWSAKFTITVPTAPIFLFIPPRNPMSRFPIWELLERNLVLLEHNLVMLEDNFCAIGAQFRCYWSASACFLYWHSHGRAMPPLMTVDRPEFTF